MKRGRQLLLVLALVCVAAATLTVVTAQPASALSYDGTDPQATGCAASAYTARYTHLYALDGTTSGALVELRYSPTCRTAWARVSDGSPYKYYDSTSGYYNVGTFASIQRTQTGTTYNCTVSTWFGSCYTRQVYDGGYTSRASAVDRYVYWDNAAYDYREKVYTGITGPY